MVLEHHRRQGAASPVRSKIVLRPLFPAQKLMPMILGLLSAMPGPIDIPNNANTVRIKQHGLFTLPAHPRAYTGCIALHLSWWLRMWLLACVIVTLSMDGR